MKTTYNVLFLVDGVLTLTLLNRLSTSIVLPIENCLYCRISDAQDVNPEQHLK
jgi:hypothetical protein